MARSKPSSPRRYLAIDLGAESGRLMLGTIEADRVRLQELHRFPNMPVKTATALTWDFPALMDGIREGLHKAGELKQLIHSLSITGWGVDYVLFKSGSEVLEPVYHYRDGRTARGVQAVHMKASREQVFQESGIQFMPLNTLYQLAAESPQRRQAARRVLLIADAVAFLLSGRARTEESAASTTALYDPRARAWSKRLTRLIGWPASKLGTIIPSGRKLGRLKAQFAHPAGLETEVIATCSHDTACAVAAVPAPADGTNWAYLSSGTWSLMGVECTKPVFSELCQQYNFTNEVGYGGSIRLLKNIIGLWLVQECRRAWLRAGQDYDYVTLTRLAAESPPFVSLMDPGDARFLAPANMLESIAGFCRETGQPVPRQPGAVIRCVLESLALIYRRTLRQLEQVTGRRIAQLHIVGGGSRNAFLNQLTADALGLPVVAGPDEATAAGNILLQAITLKHLHSLAAARGLVEASFGSQLFRPKQGAAWKDPVARFERWS